ncbi:LysR family transcriptional regulator [soil metagenome]
MNLRAIDLNLLTILDALLDEAHVSRAAERIGLSQPAASSALERCRHLFKDRLLERGPGGMRLTPKAQALREPLRQIMAGITRLLDQPEPDLQQLKQTVRLLMADQPASAVAAFLQRQLASSAPGIELVIQPWLGAADALDRLARGEIDLAASVFTVLEPAFRRRALLQEHYVVAMRQGHPAAAGFDLEHWLDWPHVLVSSQGHTRGALDEALQALGQTRRIGVVVPSFLMVPPLLLGTDLLAMLPSRCLPADGRFAAFPPPIAVEGFALHLAWHERRDDDVAVQHVARLVSGFFRDDAPP